jgi:putative Mg2+ transporter-C (MgtC) family protein
MSPTNVELDEALALSHVQLEILLRLAVAAVTGMLIGAEREMREQAAGLRTHILVAVGSCLFTLVSVYGFDAFSAPHASIDPSRVAAQIVTGIGFLGAGAILREGVTIHGLTTAASLWIVAAIGMAVGVGMYWAVAIAAVITIVALWLLRPIRRTLHRFAARRPPDDAGE